MSTTRQALSRQDGRKLFMGSAPKASRFPVAPKIDRMVDGILFDSKKEASRYAELKLLERAGEVDHIRCQVPLDVRIGGQNFCVFTCDFVYADRKGLVVYEEIKSSGTAKDAAYRLRRKSAELYYGITIVEIIK